VKIEGDFIRDIVSDWRDRIFVKSIVALAKGMRIKTVAEYVESEDILKVLKEVGVDCGQGFYFGRPSPELTE
jgi:EAL domain-containing protein (putative c-di-GMP-specific phosphodiesterase class I)